MKYTSPAYINEKIETADVICTSPYQVAWVPVTNANGEVQKDENGDTEIKADGETVASEKEETEEEGTEPTEEGEQGELDFGEEIEEEDDPEEVAKYEKELEEALK